MVTLMEKNRQNLDRIKAQRPECYGCERDMHEYVQQKGAKVWKKGGGGAGVTYGRRARYYCNDCKKDLFEGVKLR